MLLRLTHNQGSHILPLEGWLKDTDGETLLETTLRDLDKKNSRVEIITVENVVSSYNQFYRELRPIKKGH